MNFRSKERVLPKAFAKIEINDEKSVIALYVENLKNLKDGYDVIALRSDYEKLNLGRINLNSQGKGEFVLDLNEEDSDIKAVALTYDKYIPLIGFKGNKLENYEALIFEPEEEFEEYEEVEYVDSNDEYGYEEIEEVEYMDSDGEYEYEEIEYIYEDDLEYNQDNESSYLEENISTEPIESQNLDELQKDIDEDKQYENVEYIKSEQEVQDSIPDKIEQKLRSNDTSQLKNSKSKKINLKDKNQNKKKIMRDEFNNTLNANSVSEKTTGKLLMPRQIKKGLKYFKEVKPFAADYIENTRWWKIDINQNTMCGYTMPYLGYINTLNYTMYSDIAMNSYKYRHYLFGVQYDEYNKRKHYIYAIPGKKSEQPDKGTTGFTTYQACDNRNSSLGYWLCFIDSKARKIER